jgi:capsid protein
MAEETKTNFLERVISVVSPERGFKRAQARAAMTFFGYDAAHPGRFRGGSGGMHKNASAESPRMSLDRIKVMWDARDMVRNDPLVGGLVDRIVLYIAGSKISYQPRTTDPQVDRLYRDFFYDWCNRSDLSGRHRLRDQAVLGTKGMITDGDHGFVKVRQGNELRLQAIESDRIGNPLMANMPMSENYINGFNINNLGQLVSVKIFRRTRTSQYYFDKEVPAEQFIHLAMHATSDQYRPASQLVRILPHARDVHELIGMAKQQQKFASMFAGFLQPTDPYNQRGAATWDAAPKVGELGSIQAEAGLVKQMPAGYGDIKFAPGSDVPTGAFIQLFETVIRLIASGLSLPYGFVWDMAVFGGVTARIELVQVDRAIARYRQMLVDRMLEPVKNDVLALAIATRQIPPTKNWKAGKWNFGGKLTGDYGHDTAANVQKLQFGLATATNLADEDGEELEEMIRTAAGEMKYKQQIAAETGVPIELMDNRFPNATQLLAAINTPPVPPPQDLISQKGDAATKQLIEILSSVGEGTTDKESAVEQIVNIFGVPRSQAEAMVPDGPGPGPRVTGGARFGQATRKLALNGNRKR